MGWSHLGISLEDLLRLIKGFVDILTLTSGYRSSGFPASWDAQNIKKAIRWGAFFENLFSHLSESDEYEVLVKEIDAALLDLTSSSSFPQGLKCLSSETLSRARLIVLEFFSQNLSLSAGHLNALLNAAVEMDLHDLAISEAVGINLYIEKLMKEVKSHDVITMNGLFVKDSATKPEFPESSKPKGLSVSSSASATNASDMKTKQQSAPDHSSFIIQELLRREASVSCLSTCEASLDSFLGLIVGNDFSGVESDLLGEQPPVKEERLIGFVLWNCWRKKNISYLLNKRTIKLLSGSNLIFDAPKAQWLRILKPLRNYTEACTDSLLEIIELSLLGFISSRWTCLVDHFVSSSCVFLPVPEQCFSILNLLEERSQHCFSEGKVMSLKEHDILEQVTALLAADPFKIWNVPPVLVAASLPSWSDVHFWARDGHMYSWGRSSVFRSYLNEIVRELKGESISNRCCSCNQDGKEHKDCELAERIWCLYIFHIEGSHLMINKYAVPH